MSVWRPGSVNRVKAFLASVKTNEVLMLLQSSASQNKEIFHRNSRHHFESERCEMSWLLSPLVLSSPFLPFRQKLRRALKSINFQSAIHWEEPLKTYNFLNFWAEVKFKKYTTSQSTTIFYQLSLCFTGCRMK